MSCSIKTNIIPAFFIASALFLYPLFTSAETGKINIHAEAAPVFPIAGWQAGNVGVGIYGAARFEWAILNWFGLEAGSSYTLFFKGEHPQEYKPLNKIDIFSASLGARFRIVNDFKGYLLSWGKKENHVGNIWGNLFWDLHANYIRTGSLNRFGADTAIGYEFSLINGLQTGPFVRFSYIYQPNSINKRDSEDAFIISAGLSFSFDIPQSIKIKEDSDKDGYYNTDDECPFKAEDFDNYKDSDGCPDPDNDNDGIEDINDKCPLEPEDFDNYKDSDGCPDPDNDNDNIPDTEDDCPDEAEIINGVDDLDGCPDEAFVKVEGNSILGGERIYFDFGMARVKSKSSELLKQLANLLEQHPEYSKITIEGNTDSVGSLEFNDQLSVKRASRVKDCLVKLGISPSRLIIKGYGEKNPYEQGNGKQIHALNRRVEFKIIEIDKRLIKKRAETEK
jgi:outer membrane protein OmpA-like peptidoglycan-associated protein